MNIIRIGMLAVLLGSAPLAADAKGISLAAAFSPDQGATALVVHTIAEVEHDIHVAAYSFTSRPIADALIEAHDRGLDIKVVMDKSQRKAHARVGPYLRAHGISTRFNDHFAIMHDKFMIIDGKVLELGSFNYTKAAETKNAENVLVVHNSRKVLDDYQTQWQALWDGGTED